MPLWRLFYHLVWSTHQRSPLITPDKEPQLYGYIIAKVDKLGCVFHAIGGVSDHVHLVVSIPPKISISDFVRQIKGSSSHFFNHCLTSPDEPFKWQDEYGVFSLGNKQLEQAIAYVNNQKQHHAEGTIMAALERDT
jgi:putative transposase